MSANFRNVAIKICMASSKRDRAMVINQEKKECIQHILNVFVSFIDS